jgi:hypothetical protein
MAQTRQTSCCHVSRVARYRVQPGELPDLRDTIKDFVQGICKDTEFDELCWGSELPESTVLAVLNGTHTNLQDLANVIRAAGFHLRLVIVNEEKQVVIGDKRFHSEFTDLCEESHCKLMVARKTRNMEHKLFGKMQTNSWNLLLGDLQ